MVIASQILTSLGIVFEFISVFIISYRVFYPFNIQKRRDRDIDEKGKRSTQKAAIDKKGVLSLVFLSIGMTFQVVALFV